MTIQSLKKFRDDGKVVPSTMCALEMLDLGWEPSLVRKISWVSDGAEYCYESPYSLSASIVNGANYVAIVESTDEQQTSSLLRLISADGRCQLVVPNTQKIAGHNVQRQFEWFNPSIAPAVNVLGIVFRPALEALHMS